MFQNLKSKNSRQSTYSNRETPTNYSKSPGVTNFSIKGNEAERLVRCRVCGFPCDRERDVRLPENSFALLGINYGSQQTAGTSLGDKRVPAAGAVATSADTYYVPNVKAGCPNCGSFLYD